MIPAKRVSIARICIDTNNNYSCVLPVLDQGSWGLGTISMEGATLQEFLLRVQGILASPHVAEEIQRQLKELRECE